MHHTRFLSTPWFTCALLAFGCSSNQSAEDTSVNITFGSKDTDPSEEQRILAEGNEFVDELGLRWVKAGTAAALEYPEDRTESPDDVMPGVDLGSLPLEQAVALLSPHAEFGGVDFTLDTESARKFTSMIQIVARERAEDDRAGLSGTPGALPAKSADDLQPQAIIGTDNRNLKDPLVC